MTSKPVRPFAQRRAFLRRSAIHIAAPVAGMMLGACGGPGSAVAQSASTPLSFPPVPAGKQTTAESADGTNIALHEYGNPAGKPMLFIHGFSQSRLCWQRQCSDAKLAGAYRIATMDLRGHGESDKPAGPYTPQNIADDISAAIAALGMSKPVLVGWSYGGLAILDYLATHGLGQVSKIVFVDASYGNSSTPGAPAQLGPGLLDNVTPMLSSDASVNARGTLDFLRACSASALANSDTAFALAYNMLATPATRAATLMGRPATPEDYDKNVMPAIRSAGIPVLAMTGAQDQVVLPSTARDIARVTGGTLISYPDTGHMPFAEAAARFNTDLAAFAA
jgi:non-heme chloroperoxidase